MLSENQKKIIQSKSRPIEYTFEISKKAKRIRIIADLVNGIRLIIPAKVSLKEAQEFLSYQIDWVEKQWLNIEKKRKKQAYLLEPFLEKNFIVYLGKKYQLVVEVGQKHWPPVEVEDQILTVYCVRADLAEKIIERWYRQQAKAVIAGSLEKFRVQIGVSYNTLTVKDQKTRWGSCSSKGNLNFSWRLILAPKPVLDYVVVHELAHLKEMNHSNKFWAIVQKYYPDYREQIKWLKDNGVGLRI